MPTLAEVIFGVSFDVDDKQLTDAEKKADAAAKKIAKSWDTVASKVQTAGVAIAGVAAAAVGLAAKAAGAGAAIDDAAKRSGAAAKDIQRLGYAAEQSGGSTEGLIVSLKFLSKSIVDARNASSPAAKALKDLGVNLADIDGKSAEQQFAVLADAFKRIDDSALKTDLALTIFGKAGGELIPLLDEGASGVRALGDELQNMGGVLSDEAIAKAAEFDDQLGKLKKQLGAFVNEVGVSLIPIVQSAAKDWDKWAIAIGGVGTAIGALKLVQLAGNLGLVGNALAAVKWGAGIAGAAALGVALGTALDNALGLSDALAGVQNVQGKRGGAFLLGDLSPEDRQRREFLQLERDAILRGERTDRGIDPVGQIDREIATIEAGAAKRSKDRKEGAALIAGGKRIVDRAGAGFGALGERLGIVKADVVNAGSDLLTDATNAVTGGPGSKKRGGGSKKATDTIDIAAFDSLAGRDLRAIAERVGATPKALQSALEAGARSLLGGDSEGVARDSALGSLGSSVGRDLRTKTTDPILSSIFGENVPDIELSSLARGADPQVLISTINNTFNFDNDFQIDGAQDPRAVADATVERIASLQTQVAASTKSAKLGFAR